MLETQPIFSYLLSSSEFSPLTARSGCTVGYSFPICCQSKCMFLALISSSETPVIHMLYLLYLSSVFFNFCPPSRSFFLFISFRLKIFCFLPLYFFGGIIYCVSLMLGSFLVCLHFYSVFLFPTFYWFMPPYFWVFQVLIYKVSYLVWFP